MNITVKNNIGEQFDIIIVRYFKFNGGNYLIFTKNEIDEAGYQKLYVSKINNMMGNNIIDEVEWNLVKDTIKLIAKANKENTALPVEDLNEKEIMGIQLDGQKPFKLTSSSVALLGANKNIQPTVVDNLTVENSTVNPVMNDELSVPVQPAVSNEFNIPAVNYEMPVVDNFAAENANVNPTMNDELLAPVQPTVSNEFNIPTVNYESQSSFITPTVEEVAPSVVTNELPSVEMNNSNPMVEIQNPTLNQPLNDFTVSSVSEPLTETIDYKKLYEEQTLKLNALTVELEQYKSVLEQLKNILK